MRLSEISYEGLPPIDGYGPGFFRIAGEVVAGPVSLLPAGRRAWRGFEDIDALLAEAPSYDVLLVGTGGETRHPPTAFREAFRAVGAAIELMATPAACRTYNVLLAEGRRIAAALLPV